MDLGEKIIDCNNEEHLVGFKITEKNVEYRIGRKRIQCTSTEYQCNG